ncbi:hypothetical protein HALLA_17225 [Halostagnicola larsenii XH-48]|uniref:Uncharacterized protein n=1 Tax=Halostagnicola larsenii XH-48 TaxID=797299 RepID=W0JV26_9EURY|nr:hypothetical protein [Halostagnicola larsenii]AHG01120.1 hypothetical protein HALLA_17225 [Halostagnicola larsenii XH-48]
MVELFIFVAFLSVIAVVSLAIWAAIDRETLDPTVVDRTEAQRRAREQGGLNDVQSSPDRTDRSDDGRKTDDRASEFGWGSRTEADETWGKPEDDSDGDDRWR